MMKKDYECTDTINIKTRSQTPDVETQKILVFQQNNSGEKKIEGVYFLRGVLQVHFFGPRHTLHRSSLQN
jgi:hypothetical protein